MLSAEVSPSLNLLAEAEEEDSKVRALALRAAFTARHLDTGNVAVPAGV